jgi:hypothetical protein
MHLFSQSSERQGRNSAGAYCHTASRPVCQAGLFRAGRRPDGGTNDRERRLPGPCRNHGASVLPSPSLPFLLALPTRFLVKIAIPLTDTDEFSPHYGGSSKFAVVEVDPRHRAVRRRMIVVPPESEPCSRPPLLRAAGVNLPLSPCLPRFPDPFPHENRHSSH